MRVFLMDLLEQIDPQAALAHAHEVLEKSASADEWAIALRTVARTDSSPGAADYLEQKVASMLSHEPWVNNPSTGFLEAFDIAVYVGSPEVVSPLTKLVNRTNNPAVAHASFLALDRLVINNPTSILTSLQANPGLMGNRVETRANFFARADVGDPAQRKLIESYLLDPIRTGQELSTFAGVFPNANYMISHNLVTQNPTPDGSTLARRDRDSLATVREWQADPRFSELQPFLRKMDARLTEFVRQAEEQH
jgi:hypothetical protein